MPDQTYYQRADEIPFIAKQTKIVLENCGKFDAESFDEYLASGGFPALPKRSSEGLRRIITKRRWKRLRNAACGRMGLSVNLRLRIMELTSKSAFPADWRTPGW